MKEKKIKQRGWFNEHGREKNKDNKKTEGMNSRRYEKKRKKKVDGINEREIKTRKRKKKREGMTWRPLKTEPLNNNIKKKGEGNEWARI